MQPTRLLYLLSALLPACAVQPLVDLGYSRFLGSALPNGVSQWLGMRYAAAPLGNLRFRAPQDPPQNRTIQVANQHGPICFSAGSPFPTAGQSDDCLFIDVYAPTKATSKSKLPVFFFIQGGGYISDANPNFNGSGLITAGDLDLIVVTFGYRVGAHGFLASTEIERNGDLNAGFLDQRKALQWVQDHITNFGGDPNHVVLGGDSAGAGSIMLHLIAFGGAPTNLFQAVIGESPFLPTQLTVPQARYQYTNVTQRAGCANAKDTLQCLREVDISVLQNANVQVPYPNRVGVPLFMFTPVIDGKVIVDFPEILIQKGKLVKVPSVFGDDTNEGTIFAPAATNTTADFRTFMENQFPGLSAQDASTILRLYPKSDQFPNHGAFFSAASNAYGEMTFTCPGILLSTVINKISGGKPTWNYRYNVIDPDNEAAGLGVSHTIELHAVWGPANAGGGTPNSYFTTNAPIIPVMQAFWTSFIRTFNPNTHRAAGTPVWEPFGTSQSRIMIQTNNTKMETVPKDQQARCNFLTSIAVENFQ